MHWLGIVATQAWHMSRRIASRRNAGIGRRQPLSVRFMVLSREIDLGERSLRIGQASSQSVSSESALVHQPIRLGRLSARHLSGSNRFEAASQKRSRQPAGIRSALREDQNFSLARRTVDHRQRFVESLSRCQTKDEFESSFYERYLNADEGIRNKFRFINMDSQRRMLRRSLQVCGDRRLRLHHALPAVWETCRGETCTS